MAKLLGIHIKNFRSLREVVLGQVAYGVGEALPSLVCFIGPNGSGKSTLLDAFGFVADCLKEGIEAACDAPHRGGFERLRSQGSTEPIEFEIFFGSADPTRPIVYDLPGGVERNWCPGGREGEFVSAEKWARPREAVLLPEPQTRQREGLGRGVPRGQRSGEGREGKAQRPYPPRDRDPGQPV